MNFHSEQVRHLLKTFNFKSLFIEKLGWDHHTATIEVPVGGQVYKLAAIAQKRGVVVFVHEDTIPDDQIRRRIDRFVAKSVHQHFIIFSDTKKGEQVWQWARRELGKPRVFRQHTFHSTQSGELLIQKLSAIAISIEEEEQLHHVEVTGRVRAAFDTEGVTKRFYERFKSEHEKFLVFIEGIPDKGLRHWYAAVMLNRLMFVYFVQKKEFLDNDIDYLCTKLEQSKQRGKDQFYTGFLCPLFFEGFARKESNRSTATNELLGKIPYLNGGLFLRHQVEELHGTSIRIGDAAFERIFAFFKEFHWHLDERPNRNDKEINPDVLGYIFEKYINAIQPGERKAKGAYYTKEDITGYISQNTIIPFLFDAARQKCKVAFEGDHSIWRLLQADPDRYIYDAVKHGVALSLPPKVAVGLNDANKRTEWNKAAPSTHALPTEIWREVIVRRKRYEDVKAKLLSGAIHSINDLTTYNLDIRQFAQDVIENCEGPGLLRAFWHAIQEVTVLDPTCGSGAFLFAALNILEPLYGACLNRMEVFLDELHRSGKKHRPEKFDDFRKALDWVANRASPHSFIYKSIIVNNLYGVDIMEEAVEICKIRLFLKMVAQVDRVEQIEPLPDIDFNIRAGNTLVGFATREDVRRAITTAQHGQMRLLSSEEIETLQRIEETAEDIDRLFGHFRRQQTELGGEVTQADKQELRRRLQNLEDELNRYLAGEYRIDALKHAPYAKWLASHKPFHWFIEFYRIMKGGGFDVVLGNPPYVEVKDVSDYEVRGLESQPCGDLYAYTLERAFVISRYQARLGVIIPMSCFSVEGFRPLQGIILREATPLFISNWSGDAHPSKLFEGVDKRLEIVLAKRHPAVLPRSVFVSKYLKWYSTERVSLFNLSPAYQELSDLEDAMTFPSSIPKLGSEIELKILGKLCIRTRQLMTFLRSEGKSRLYYTRKVSFFLQFLNFVPEVRDNRGRLRDPSELKALGFEQEDHRDLCLACLSSSLFYWYYISNSDCRNLNKREILAFPIPQDVSALTLNTIKKSIAELMQSYRTNSTLRTVSYKKIGAVTVQYFNFRRSKAIIDKIDRVLAKHYGFTDEELDFIINYDIKYRMGQDTEENGDHNQAA